MNFRIRFARACLLPLLLASGTGFAADWPPELDRSNTVLRSQDGLAIERYTHGLRAGWAYPANNTNECACPPAQESGVPGQNHRCFYVVAPKRPRAHAPLCVVLHSANRTAYDQLVFQHIKRGDPTVCTWVPDDGYALYLSSGNREWWGWSLRRANPKVLSPAEKRVLDTIEWVVTRYQIDRQRIYLTGLSMGGCGTLAIGMAHGDVFAAIRAQVPAGTEYVAACMGGFPAEPAAGAAPAERDAWIKRISGGDLPDPPILIDFSAQNDNWSKTQPALLQAAQAGRFPLVLGWGPFGHPTFTSPIAKFPLCAVALAFPWMEIRKNEAYPVFTHASSDQHPPWLGASTNFDASGQMNAYFRWKNQTDMPSAFTMQLWLAHPAISNAPPTMPEASIADVTLRRLQRFKVQPGTEYAWRLVRGGQTVGSGSITPDAANLLTIPQVTVTTKPAELSVTAEKR